LPLTENFYSQTAEAKSEWVSWDYIPIRHSFLIRWQISRGCTDCTASCNMWLVCL